MPTYHLPVELDLRHVPPVETLVSFEADLPQVAAHAGHEGSLVVTELLAELSDGRTLQAQFQADTSAPRVAVLLPADVAAAPGIRLTLQVAVAGDTPARLSRVLCSQGAHNVEIQIDGDPFTTYRYDTRDPELPRPYFHPLLGPTGVPLTQDGEFPGTNKGHIWHTGLVLAHQNFTDGNNWQTGSPKFSRMRHVAFDVMESGPLLGRFIQRLEWLNVAGDRTVFHETRTITIPARAAQRRCLDIDTTITCGSQPAVWNATPYHLLAIRMPDAMLIGKGGIITNSEGQSNPPDGTSARWLDYSGPLGAATAGVTLFDHPQNLRHPTSWLNFQAQTIGAAPAHREPLSWKEGEARRFRYRVYVHAGDVKQALVAQEYAAYVAEPEARIGVPRRLA
jgi:hypothetical protein